MSPTLSSRLRRPGADAGPAADERAGRARRVWSILPVCVGFAVFGVIVWLAYQDASLGPPVGEPPLIKAAAEPIKLPPEPAQEPTLAAEQGAVGRLWSDTAPADQPERLLPPPEEPMAPPVLEAPPSAEPTPEAPARVQAAPAGPPAPASPDDAPAREAARADADAGVAAPPSDALPAAPDAAAVQAPSDESLQEAEAALDRLLAEVTALAEDDAAPAAAQRPADQAALETSPDRAETPGSEPPPTTVAAPAQGVAPAVPPQKPAAAAPRATSRTSAEVRPASALTGAPAAAPPAREPATETAALTGAPTTAPPAREAATETAARTGAGTSISTPPVVPDGEFRIQLAAVRGEADAQRAWNLFMGDLGPVLSDIQPIFERADTANGVFYRVQIGPFASQQAADTLCEDLKRRNASCFVIRR